MWEQSDFAKEPEEETVSIWRDTDFSKFVHLLVNKTLFFARADTFKDPFEGLRTKINVELLQKQFGKELQFVNKITEFTKKFRRFAGVQKNWCQAPKG
jgi:hypothetical protein